MPTITFELTLEKTLTDKCCPSAVKNAVCQFRHEFDHVHKAGRVVLERFNGMPTEILLNPLGPTMAHAFMSDGSPTSFEINDEEVIVDLLVVNLDMSGAHAAAIMFGLDGACVEATTNFIGSQIDLVARTAPNVRVRAGRY
ncbi:hypothetical protein [Synoicihabitans lomoniglobus]|uniref:Uncharacterized protein n=1 Tax=Synoicihabitans lomoniglobus TaxID=2909285 RepID=A0AAF0CMV4_9BACT|nr:hypothetical protein [Opitutaceae bacterium LMO-M01]WED64683.1 hypothetical protein PXH66_20255 [Opitutaceae bacterium LMO-M01]